MVKILSAFGVLMAAAVVAVVIGARTDSSEPVFTFGEAEVAFDAAGLEVEPADPNLEVFLDPTGDEDFSVLVFDDADEAKWSYDELRRMRDELDSVLEGSGATEAGLLRRRGNVLVHSDRNISPATRRKIERALTQLGTFLPSRASASRPPTLSEREQITMVFSAFIRNAPVECVWLDIRISSRNASYAQASAQVLNWRQPGSRCLRYASNGFDILRKRQGKWRVIYSGSVEPPCALRVPRDLVGCAP